MILLDVSTCLAAFWPAHQFHERTRSWVDAAENGALGLCRIVQLGWLRHLTDPAILGEDAITRAEAWEFVESVMSDARFGWLHEDTDLDVQFAVLAARDERSHKLWTDDYLAAFALAGGHSFATLDTRVRGRYPDLAVIDPLDSSTPTG